jgi:UDP-N-acetylmuramoyl-tripeptide--D-alanyl-D-alanine ligase
MLPSQHGFFFIFVVQLLAAMITTEEIYKLFIKSAGISTDSRNIFPGSIFFALKGDQYDGNLFATEAIEKGAIYAVVDNPGINVGEHLLQVNDALDTLQQLASIHRNQIKAKIIGITGSNGKTTTKELIGKVLSSQFNTVVTRGNLNNHIGVPLTILSIREETSFAVIEMGANHPGEIAALCQIARPGYGIITNIGKAHLEGFGSFEGVIKAKSELYDFIKQNNGVILFNSDDHLLTELSEEMNRLAYGSDQNAMCRGEITARDPYLEIKWSGNNLSGLAKTYLIGDYNFGNVLAAISIGLYFGVNPARIDQAIASYIPENNRSQVIRTERNLLVMDAYNANPSSMKAALVNFNRMKAAGKMVILGDMMELGEYSLEEHIDLINFTDGFIFNKVLYIGEMFSLAAGNGNQICFPGIREAETWLHENPVREMTILLKGSRKMQLENLQKLL